MGKGAFRHVPQLDGLRAIAILLVFVAHCGLDRIVPGGLGVTIFFFLSGYLITSLLRSEAAQTGRVDLAAFYVRRTLRIWPPLWITMAFALAATVALRLPARVDLWAVVAQLGFVSNYSYLWHHDAGVPAMPLWSLAVEEHFYLAFPLLFAILLARRPWAWGAACCAILCLAVLALRLVLVDRVGWSGSLYYWSHTRVDSILFGCCLALWNNPALDEAAWRPRRRHVAGALAVILLCIAIRDEWFRQTLRYTLQGAALFVLFSAALQAQGGVGRLLASWPLRLVALYSYTLYLVHMFVLDEIVAGLPLAGRAMVGGALSFGYAAAMYALVEQPIARRRRALHTVDKGATVSTV